MNFVTRVTVVMFILHFKLKHSALAASANSTRVLLKFKVKRQMLYLIEIPGSFLSVLFLCSSAFCPDQALCITIIIMGLKNNFLKNKADIKNYITTAKGTHLLREPTDTTFRKKKKLCHFATMKPWALYQDIL